MNQTRKSMMVLSAVGTALVLSAAAPHPAAASSELLNDHITKPARTVLRSEATEAPVADAAMRGDTAKVRSLLKLGVDANAAQADGMTALHWAAGRGDAVSARMLIFAGARLDATTRNGSYTPLHIAAQAGRAAVVKALVEAGADVTASTTSGGATALHLAAAQGNAESVGLLLDHGARINARENAWAQTALMWAAAYDRLAVLELLIKRGAELEAVSMVENIPERERADRTSNALRNRKVAALKSAEQAPGAPGAVAGAGAGTPTTGRGGPPGGGRGDATGATGRAGAPGVQQGPGAGAAQPRQMATTATPLTAKDSALAAQAPKPVTAAPANTEPAIGGTGNPNNPQAAAGGGRGGRGGGQTYGDLVGNKGGLTALLFAVREGNTDCVQALLKAGAKVNHVSGGDKTSPLLMATINGHFDLAKYLLENKADAKLASDAGATPLYATINVQWAAKSLYPQPTAQLQQKITHLELMEALLKAGADPNVRLTKHLWYMSYNFDLLGVNTTGATPFWRAAYGTDVDAMKLLMKYGADPNIPTKKPAGVIRGEDAPVEDDSTNKGGADPSGLPPVPADGPGVMVIHAASGVGYGEGYAANSHRHAPDGWLPSVKYLVEELHMDVNARDFNGYNAVHHAAARGDTVLIAYLVSKGADVKAVSRKGQTTADMANGPVQRIPPFVEAVAFLEKLGSKNSHKCRSC